MLPDHVLDQVRAGGLLPAGAPVLVLLSGGRDSTCLLDVTVRLAGVEAVSALHVNYGLREDADGDERHCRRLCDWLGIKLEVERPRRPEGSGNLQAWARDVRYAEAARRALPRGAAIATGHTASDQVETILYRLASSPSRRALLGMPARDGRLVRPLLGLTREETTAYCVARGLTWRDDVTNDGDRYARNRVRNAVIPALRTIHPAAEANVLRAAERLRDEAEVLDALVADELGGGAPGGEIALERLAELGPALRRLVVQRLADNAAGRPVPGAGRRADAVAALRPRGTAMLDLGGGVRAVAEYGIVRAERIGEDAEPPTPVTLPVPGAVAFGGWELRCEEAADAIRGDGVLDRAALAGSELLVRPWQPGDRMTPVGLDGSKTLGDLFTACRIPLAQRRTLPLVVSGEEIAWVPGVATSARFGITPATRAAVRLTASAPA